MNFDEIMDLCREPWKALVSNYLYIDTSKKTGEGKCCICNKNRPGTNMECIPETLTFEGRILLTILKKMLYYNKHEKDLEEFKRKKVVQWQLNDVRFKIR